ncbi:ADP-glyceromanno-heptose 6-epimerase [Candidatus Woesearchaeota archaeon]|nr:ADP-glyceromanno-heptose 6-epimerase [Candidatus Woesearchaeota archaeon]
MIVITGGAGFIGSCIAKELNNQGVTNIIIVDNLKNPDKKKNLNSLQYVKYYDKAEFLKLLEKNKLENVDLIIHVGACSSTTEKNDSYLIENNYNYSKKVHEWCQKNDCRLIYASSAATYGDGALGYDDDESKQDELSPLNTYGVTKKAFDQYILQAPKLKQCVGLKYFNVYGPNEYHKGRMASVVFHGFNQAIKDGEIRLFKSAKESFADGEQTRDFVYVKDAVAITLFFKNNPQVSGIFNVGTGIARTFNDLAKSIFKALGKSENIKYIDMPQDLKAKYQYHTQANMQKLRDAGYTKKIHTLEEGITDYVQNYLAKNYALHN